MLFVGGVVSEIRMISLFAWTGRVETQRIVACGCGNSRVCSGAGLVIVSESVARVRFSARIMKQMTTRGASK